MDTVHTNTRETVATPRKGGFEGHPCYDLFDVWPHRHVKDGLVHDSAIVIYVADLGLPEGTKATVRVWRPSIGPVDIPTERGHKVALPMSNGPDDWGNGIASAACLTDQELRVTWVDHVGLAPS